MFEEIIRELKKLEKGVSISVPIEKDENGYIEKECPSEQCKFIFKVLEEDWLNLFSDEAVYCPLCRHSAPADHWWTTDQIEHAEQEAFKQFKGLVGDALYTGSRTFNRKQPKGGFIQLSLEYKGTRGSHRIVPVPVGEPWELYIACEACGAHFSVLGSAFFCPCCGHNSVEQTFNDALRKIRLKINSASEIKKILSKEGRTDDGELLKRSLIETSLSDCVIAFQRMAEQLYAGLANVAPAPRNVFQRIDEGSLLWQQAIGKGYEDFLQSSEISELQRGFQKRHILQHSDGIIDQQYIDRSGDHSYVVGQRIVVSPTEIYTLAELIEKLATGLRESITIHT